MERKHQKGWKYQLRWGNPYTQPPNGLPRMLAEFDHDPTMAERIAVYPAYRLGCGFSIAIQFPWHERKTLDAATKLKRRERMLKTLEMNRVKEKLPLLADAIIAAEKLDWRRYG